MKPISAYHQKGSRTPECVAAYNTYMRGYMANYRLGLKLGTISPKSRKPKERAMPSKNVKDMTKEELFAEHKKWDDTIVNATHWGGGLAAANEFRREAAREIVRRGLGNPVISKAY